MADLPLFLLTNDDGVHAPGIKALAKEISKIGRVITVAPSGERSAQSQAITISHPLRVFEIDKNTYGVDGTPADCVMLALQQLLQEKPAWVISGINRGGNLGTDILYSGTVGAALEACISGLRAMAISLEGIEGEPMNYDSAAVVARKIIENAHDFALEQYELLNVNVPDFPFEGIRGLRTATVGRRIYEGKMWERQDPRGHKYYWVGGGGFGHEDIPGSDCVTCYQGFATVSVLRPDFFHREATDRVSRALEHSNLRDFTL